MYPLNATDAQKELVCLPVSIIKDLKLENQTQMLSELNHYKTENSFLWPIMIVLMIISSILGIYIFYVDYWVPTHEE